MDALPDWLPDWWREFPDDVLRLGTAHYGKFTQWSPDRELNPQYADMPDVNPYGLMIAHISPAGRVCMSHVTFDSETARSIDAGRPMWQVQSLDPLHLEPSVLCRAPYPEGVCNDHGFIRGGAWVPA